MSDATGDPVAADIANRNPDTDDQVAGEEVLADDPTGDAPKVAPEPDDLHNGSETDAEQVEETDRDRAERHD
jgi:hypothetical protein